MSLYSFLRGLLKPLVYVLWPTKIVNKENFEKFESGIVICNHYSISDTLIPAARLYKKEIHVLAKAEAFKNPIANKFLRKMGAIPIHRGEADIEAVKEVLRVLKANKRFTMYPEGTRNKEGTENMREFKQGCARFAIQTKKPILPMIYYRKHKVFRKNYLYIGEPFTLEEFYHDKSQDAFEKATEMVYEKMLETRKLCNEYVESLKNKKDKKSELE